MVTKSEQKPQVNVRQITEEDIDSVLAIDRAITGSNRAITYTTIPGSFVEADLERIIYQRSHYSSRERDIFSGFAEEKKVRPKKGWTKAGGNHLGPSRRNYTDSAISMISYTTVCDDGQGE